VQIDSDTEQIRALEEALRNTENNAAQGTALRSDVLQAQAALAQARYSLASDQNARINSREQLNYQLARDVDTDFAVEVLPPVSQDEMSLADARATALKERPELREAQLQEQKADLAVRQEKATYIPELNAQFTYLSFQNISFLPQNAATVGLSLQWKSPWDWGYRRANIAGLRDAAKQQVLSTEDTTQQITVDIDQKFRALAQARLLVEVASVAKQASAEQLRNVENQFQEHTAFLSDVLKQAAQDRQQSETYTQALTTFWNARAALDQSLGRD